MHSNPLASFVARVGLAGQLINRILDGLVAGLLALMVLDVGIGILFRYVLGNPLGWTEELARYLMIWTAALAIATGVSRREHIGFTLLIGRFPYGMRRTLSVGFDLLILVFFGVLFIYGSTLFMTGRGQNTMSLGVTMAGPYAAIPVSAAIAMLQASILAIGDAFSHEPMDSHPGSPS